MAGERLQASAGFRKKGPVKGAQGAFPSRRGEIFNTHQAVGLILDGPHDIRQGKPNAVVGGFRTAAEIADRLKMYPTYTGG